MCDVYTPLTSECTKQPSIPFPSQLIKTVFPMCKTICIKGRGGVVQLQATQDERVFPNGYVDSLYCTPFIHPLYTCITISTPMCNRYTPALPHIPIYTIYTPSMHLKTPSKHSKYTTTIHCYRLHRYGRGGGGGGGTDESGTGGGRSVHRDRPRLPWTRQGTRCVMHTVAS